MNLCKLIFYFLIMVFESSLAGLLAYVNFRVKQVRSFLLVVALLQTLLLLLNLLFELRARFSLDSQIHFTRP